MCVDFGILKFNSAGNNSCGSKAYDVWTDSAWRTYCPLSVLGNWVWLIEETFLFCILCKEPMTVPTRLKDPNILCVNPYLKRRYMLGTCQVHALQRTELFVSWKGNDTRPWSPWKGKKTHTHTHTLPHLIRSWHILRHSMLYIRK